MLGLALESPTSASVQDWLLTNIAYTYVDISIGT